MTGKLSCDLHFENTYKYKIQLISCEDIPTL